MTNPRRLYIIGDRLNTSNRNARSAVDSGDVRALRSIAQAQLANGADALDFCACAAASLETKHLRLLLSALAPDLSRVTCSIDTRDPDTVKAIRARVLSPPILNCYSGSLDSIEEMQDAIRCAAPMLRVVAVCVDFHGTNVTPQERLDIARRMEHELTRIGVQPEQIIFDPVTMPAAAGPEAENVMLETTRLLRDAFPHAGVLCAVSNFSYGLAKRRVAERRFVTRAKAYGADVFLLNALDATLCKLVREN